MKTITAIDLKRIIHQAMESDPPPLLHEPIENENPPELQLESLQNKLSVFIDKLTPEERDSLFSKWNYVLKSKVSKEITANILKNISNIKNATSGKL